MLDLTTHFNSRAVRRKREADFLFFWMVVMLLLSTQYRFWEPVPPVPPWRPN